MDQMSQSRGPQIASPATRSPEDIREAARLLGLSVEGLCLRIEIPVPEEQPWLGSASQEEPTMAAAPQLEAPAQSLLFDIFDPEPWQQLDDPSGDDFLQSLGNIPEPPDISQSLARSSSGGTIPVPHFSAFDLFLGEESRFPVDGTVATRETTNSAIGLADRESPLNSNSSESDVSSWLIPTPSPRASQEVTPTSVTPSVSDSWEVLPAVTAAEVQSSHQNTPRFGMCSREWKIPRRTRQRKKGKDSTLSTGNADKSGVSKPARRTPFPDEKARRETAQTRNVKSCIRCRMQQIRCRLDPQDPNGVCLTCKKIKRPLIYKLPCLRWIITDSSLYREQKMPWQVLSKRWQSMDMVDIDTWASTEVKTVQMSQIFLNAPYEMRVREFIPIEGDMVDEQWMDGTEVKTHPVPRYALADMHESATRIKNFIDANVGIYIDGAIGKLDNLLWHTYLFAFRYQPEAKTEPEKRLLLDCFRLWVACRKTSHPEHICGDDKLGGEPINDPSSPSNNLVCIPLLITAQLECIIYTKVLRPKSEQVLRQLNELVKKNRREYWMTIYLTVFILLHSCSMITRRDWETARRYNVNNLYANPESIMKHHAGCQTMLAHFHYLNKGVFPFQMVHNTKDLEELQQAACLSENGVKFVQETAAMVHEPQRVALFREAREQRDFGHDFFWVSQLYDTNWEPGPTAG